MARWDSNADYKNGPNALVFSVNHKKYFRNLDVKKLVGCQKQFGPKFGNGHANEIWDNCLSKAENYSAGNNTYGNNLGLTEDQYFSLNELEIFLIEHN